MKSTSSVLTRIDGFTIGMNSQLQDTHAQSSGENESTHWEQDARIARDLGMRAKLNLRMWRQGSEGIGGKDKVKHLLRARSRDSERSRSVASSDGDEPGRHSHETLAESQTGSPQEVHGKELRERNDVPSRHRRAYWRIRRGFRRRSTWMMLTRRERMKDDPRKAVGTGTEEEGIEVKSRNSDMRVRPMKATGLHIKSAKSLITASEDKDVRTK